MIKMFYSFIYLIPLFLAFNGFVSAKEGGSDVGHGSDNVDILFTKAKQDAQSLLARVQFAHVDWREIDPKIRDWFKNSNRLIGLRKYIIAELKFQDEACLDHITSGGKRGACYDDSEPDHPRVIISREMNIATTPEQAIVMLLHEAGHFLKESDHQLLNDIGLALLQMVSSKKRLTQDLMVGLHFDGKVFDVIQVIKPVNSFRDFGSQPTVGDLEYSCFNSKINVAVPTKTSKDYAKILNVFHTQRNAEEIHKKVPLNLLDPEKNPNWFSPWGTPIKVSFLKEMNLAGEPLDWVSGYILQDGEVKTWPEVDMDRVHCLLVKEGISSPVQEIGIVPQKQFKSDMLIETQYSPASNE